MKTIVFTIVTMILAASLCGCDHLKTDEHTTTEPSTAVTETPTTQEPVTPPTEEPSLPNMPEETESRGSTDDTSDDPNEQLPEEAERIRRRIMG